MHAPSIRDLILCLLLCGVLTTSALLYYTNIYLNWSGASIALPITIISSIACPCIYNFQGNTWIAKTVNSLDCIGLILLSSLIGSISSYPLASLSTGWMDDKFLFADAALGLNWAIYWKFVQSLPILNYSLDSAYTSFFFTPAILVVSLVFINKKNIAHQFILSFIIALIITNIMSVYLPAKSAAAIFLPGDTPNLPAPGLLHIPIIEQLRNGSYNAVPVMNMAGLIAFPSFHAAASIIFMGAGWHIPWLRYPCLIVNTLMLLSTPIQGGHYFIETLGGVVVGSIAILFTRFLAENSSKANYPPAAESPWIENGACFPQRVFGYMRL